MSLLVSARAHLVDYRHRLLRYGGASAVGVVLGQTILRVCYDLLGWSALVANLVAFLIANIPVYHLNRSWVWDRSGPSSWRREVLPFWLVSFAGLALSSLAVGLIDRVTGNGWLITVASVGAFGTVWLVKYAVCDQYLFGPPGQSGDHDGPNREMAGDHNDPNREMAGDHDSSNRGMAGDHDSSNRGMAGDHNSSNRGMAGDGARPAGVR
ncbi:GtrA family protein [Candidatus Poriferisocius sp.]|uniref:GtrA family protein n=1 Tax=Candidatus Poriferisocius sp. TaxID=3101276 RepID=UPI003B01E90E